MSAEIVTEKYANALFDALNSPDAVKQASSDLEAAAKAFSSQGAIDFFTNPFNSQDSKVAVAKSSLEGKVSAEVFNFIATLVTNERIHLIDSIAQAFKAKASQVGGEAEGTVYVVETPSAEFVSALEKKVSTILKKTVRLKTQTDKSLISGFKVQVEGWTLDDSALHHLKKLTENISTRGL